MAESRDYEAELYQEFSDMGCAVISRDEYKAIGIPSDPEHVLVYQFLPDLVNPSTGRKLKYVLDFAYPSVKAYLEFDGFFGSTHGVGGHRNWAGFHRDRLKDRLMTFMGWRGLRYGPGDLKKPRDVMAVADEFIGFCIDLKNGNIR